MIKFEFTLTDKDASNLLDILNEAKCKALIDARAFIKPNMTRADQANADWYNGHAEYLEGLKQKILTGHSRV